MIKNLDAVFSEINDILHEITKITTDWELEQQQCDARKKENIKKLLGVRQELLKLVRLLDEGGDCDDRSN